MLLLHARVNCIRGTLVRSIINPVFFQLCHIMRICCMLEAFVCSLMRYMAQSQRKPGEHASWFRWLQSQTFACELSPCRSKVLSMHLYNNQSDSVCFICIVRYCAAAAKPPRSRIARTARKRWGSTSHIFAQDSTGLATGLKNGCSSDAGQQAAATGGNQTTCVQACCRKQEQEGGRRGPCRREALSKPHKVGTWRGAQ